MSKNFLELHAEITKLLEEFGAQWESVSHKTAIQTILDNAGIAHKPAPVTSAAANAIIIETDVTIDFDEETLSCDGCDDCEKKDDGCSINAPPLQLLICFNGYDRLVCFKVMP